MPTAPTNWPCRNDTAMPMSDAAAISAKPISGGTRSYRTPAPYAAPNRIATPPAASPGAARSFSTCCERLTPAQPLGADEQRDTQQCGQHATRCRAKQPLIDGVTYQEHASQQQRAGTKPDSPARRQQCFEVRSLCRFGHGGDWLGSQVQSSASGGTNSGSDTGSGSGVGSATKVGTDVGVGSGAVSRADAAVAIWRRRSAISRSARRDLKYPRTPRNQPPIPTTSNRMSQTTRSSSIAKHRSHVPR